MELALIFISFGLTFLFALIFGLERQRAHKPIGFGTFIFVSMGSCALGVVALIFNKENPLPLLGATVTGIGFLGAGALIKTTDKIFGFTTAASIWIFSIIGLIMGVREYLIASLLYLVVWLIVFIDKILEKKGIGSYQKKLYITMNKNIHSAELASVMKIKNYKLFSVDVNLKDNLYNIVLLVEGSKKNVNGIPKILSKLDYINSFKFE